VVVVAADVHRVDVRAVLADEYALQTPAEDAIPVKPLVSWVGAQPLSCFGVPIQTLVVPRVTPECSAVLITGSVRWCVCILFVSCLYLVICLYLVCILCRELLMSAPPS
jgi:hypothetical protein